MARLTVRRWFVGLLIAVTLGWLAALTVESAMREPPNYTEVEPGLYVGGWVPEAPPKVGATLNLCEFEDRFKSPTHDWKAIADAEPAPSLDWLRDRVKFVADNRKAGKVTYVHCLAGISRSAMVTAAYLMQDRGMTRDEAVAFLQKTRPQVRPNPAFMELLATWETELKKEKAAKR